MDKLILVSSKNLYSVSLLLLSLVLLIFLIKKFIKNPSKIIKYLYFIYFIFIFRVFSRTFLVFNTDKSLGIFYIILSFSMIKFIDILLNESYYKNKKNLEIPHLIRNIVVVIAFIISFLFILKNYFDINLTSLLTTSAILSAVIGLAVQDTLTTFIAGLVLTSDNSIEIGDTIIFKDIVGKVIDTNWRSTKLEQRGGGIVSIPNNLIVKDTTINYYKSSDFVIDIKVSASYSDPPNKVKEILLKVAFDNEKILRNPEPIVIISSYGDSGINYELRLWINDEYMRRVRTKTEIYSAIWYAFKRNNIKIPFPVREILTQEDMVEKTCVITKMYFKNVEFFKALTDEDFVKLSSIAVQKIYGKNEYIFFQGDEGDSFYMITSGKVEIILDNRSIAELKEGDFFGEMSLLTGNPRSASVKALEDVEVLIINKDSFKKIIQENNVLLNSVLEYLTKREEENESIRQKINLSIEGKEKQKRNIKRSTLKKLMTFFEI